MITSRRLAHDSAERKIDGDNQPKEAEKKTIPKSHTLDITIMRDECEAMPRLNAQENVWFNRHGLCVNSR